MKTAIAFTTAALLTGTASADIIITGYLDGTTDGTSRVMELYAEIAIADLNDYTIQRASNGGSFSNAVVNWNDFSGPVAAGSFFYVVASNDDKTALEGVFGAGSMDPSESNGGLSGNGNDAFRIVRESDSAVLDTMGDPGNLAPWDHENGWMYRNDNTGPDGGSFVLANWTIDSEGPDSTFPIGTYIPEPGSLALLSLGGLLVARRRRG